MPKTLKLADCRKGKEIQVIASGRVIARVVIAGDPQRDARKRLLAARRHCVVGDLVTPIEVRWTAASR